MAKKMSKSQKAEYKRKKAKQYRDQAKGLGLKRRKVGGSIRLVRIFE